jgi:hypothetical protein
MMHRTRLVIGLLCTGAVQSYPIQHCRSLCNCFRSRNATFTRYSTKMRVRGGGGTDRDIQKSKEYIATAADAKSLSNPNINMEKYHLVWSPNFWKKLVINLALWAVLGSIQRKFNIVGSSLFKGSYAAPCHNVASKVSLVELVLPFLSSSCCAIQLIINAISGLGCAGFNTYLGKSICTEL